MANRFLALVAALLLVAGALPVNSVQAQVGCSQETVVITPPQTGTFDSRFNATPVAPTGFMAVLFVGTDMPGEPQKAVLLRSGGAFTFSTGVFYAVCSPDLRGLAVRHGWWDLYVRDNYLSPVEVWDMTVPPRIRIARWEVQTQVPAPQPVPSPYPYPIVPQPVAPPFPSFPYQPVPMPITFQPPLQPCGPLNYTTVSPDLGRVYGAAAVRATFDGLRVVKAIFGDQTLIVQGARLIEVVEAPGCGSQVVGVVANNLIAQGGSVSYDSAPSEFQSKFSITRRP